MPAGFRKALVWLVVALCAGLVWQFGFKPRMDKYDSYVGGITDVYRLLNLREYTSSHDGSGPQYLKKYYWRVESSDGQVRNVLLPKQEWFEPIGIEAAKSEENGFELAVPVTVIKVSGEPYPQIVEEEEFPAEAAAFLEELKAELAERAERNKNEGLTASIKPAGMPKKRKQDAEVPGTTDTVTFETSKGTFVMKLHPDWAPLGVQRVKDLVGAKVFDDARFYRVVPGFVVQFGLAADPAVTQAWQARNLQDEPVKASNTKGMVTFAMGGPNTRSMQLFINLTDNSAQLDGQKFAPIGEIVEGMEVVEALNGEYGAAPGNAQTSIVQGGNRFLNTQFPNLDYITSARFTE